MPQVRLDPLGWKGEWQDPRVSRYDAWGPGPPLYGDFVRGEASGFSSASPLSSLF